MKIEFDKNKLNNRITFVSLSAEVFEEERVLAVLVKAFGHGQNPSTTKIVAKGSSIKITSESKQ